MEQLRPKDLAYQILHGLRSLTEYDHSAAVLTCDPDMQYLELVAEKIAWRKGKSRRVGLKLPLDDDLRRLIRRDCVYGFDREDITWRAWNDADAIRLAELLDYNLSQSFDPRDDVEGTMLCAPLVTNEGVLGVLRVSGTLPGRRSGYEAGLVGEFIPHASTALKNAQHTEALE